MSSTGKKCEEIRQFLIDRAMGQLDAPALSAVEQHVAACPQCRAYADELAAADQLLSSAPSVTPSRQFDAALAARLKEERGRQKVQRATVFAAFAAGLRRLRRFELGVAVYPLVFLCLVYVLWAVATRQPHVRRTYGDGHMAHGKLMLWPNERNVAEPEVASPQLAEIEESVTREDAPAPATDVFVPMIPELTFAENLIGVRVVRAARPALREPETVEQLVKMPDPPEQVATVLPTGAPGGSALARKRFLRIKNSRMRSARQAISRGVIWLCRNQDRAGFWASDSPEYSREEVTAAAALAMMESGFTPKGKSTVSKHLRSALMWLIRQRRPDGMFASPGARQWHGHAMVCVALNEALRLSDNEALRKRFRPIVESAAAKLAQGQSASGMWGDEDAELTTLVVMAAGSARAGGLAVDASAHTSRMAWLGSFGREKRTTTLANVSVTYKAGQSRSYGAIGVVLGSPEREWSAGGAARQVSKTLVKSPVIWGAGDFFRWYAGTLAAYRLSGPSWLKWRRQMLESLLRYQRGALGSKTAADDRGSWTPHGITKRAGRAHSTAMAVLTLTASYGHSPLYGSTR